MKFAEEEKKNYYENFVKAKINGILKVQYLVNMADESELPSQAVTVFAWPSNTWFCSILMEDYAFSVDLFLMLFECYFQLA